jgi:hypothetical protein
MVEMSVSATAQTSVSQVVVSVLLAGVGSPYPAWVNVMVFTAVNWWSLGAAQLTV